MKTNLPFSGTSILRTSLALVVLFAGMLLAGTSLQAQIYAPEGLNMPGAWDSWTNPPANLVLASSTQVTGGKIERIDTGTPRYQTMFSADATGGDLVGGTYEWLFTSGSTSNYYQNKWSAVTITMNTLQLYTKEGAANNNITLVNGKWYTMNYEDLGYVDTRAIFMETSSEPIDINTVSVPASVAANTPATINVGLSDVKSPEENIFLRYSTDAWVTSLLLPVTVTGTSGTATIPGQVDGTVVSYYAFSSTLATITADYDLVTIRLNNNEGLNYSYTVAAPPPVISFANLQWPDAGYITLYADYDVFGQAYIAGQTGITGPAPGLMAWVGYSTTNNDPATWTTWVPAIYNGPVVNNDEFKANLGPVISTYGTYYYATRFQLNAGPYVYGGYSITGGGFWDGVANKSGILNVIVGIPEGRESAIAVYPNPTTGNLIIDLPASATIQFTNALGNVILQKETLSGKQTIDISAFKAGVYHLQVTTGNQTSHQTIIKR